MIEQIARWVGLRPQIDARDVRIVLFTREGCTCCHKAYDVLEAARRSSGFSLELRDVDAEAALVEAHGDFVPVVEVNGKVRFRGQVNPALLERLLLGESRGDDAS